MNISHSFLAIQRTINVHTGAKKATSTIHTIDAITRSYQRPGPIHIIAAVRDVAGKRTWSTNKPRAHQHVRARGAAAGSVAEQAQARAPMAAQPVTTRERNLLALPPGPGVANVVWLVAWYSPTWRSPCRGSREPERERLLVNVPIGGARTRHLRSSPWSARTPWRHGPPVPPR
jgi:hypothetical protein